MNRPSAASSADPLSEALARVEPPVSPEAYERLASLFGMLRAWKGAGIVGFGSPEDLARHYFREALLLRGFLPERGPFLDVGSGGGTPALPLALAGNGDWTLLEPQRVPATFLDLAVENLGLGARVRVVRQRLKDFLKSETGQATLARVSAVTMRAVRLQAAEWTLLAAALPSEARVIWPTSRAARQRAELSGAVFDEELAPAERGVVWIGRPRS